MISVRPLRVLLAVPAAGLRGAIAELLAASGRDLDVQIAPDAADIVASQTPPDVLVVTDQVLTPHLIAALRSLRDRAPGTTLVVVSLDASRPVMAAVRSTGAHAMRAERLASDLPALLGDLRRGPAASGASRAPGDGDDQRDAGAVPGP